MEPSVHGILGPPIWGVSVTFSGMVRLNGSTLRERSNQLCGYLGQSGDELFTPSASDYGALTKSGKTTQTTEQ